MRVSKIALKPFNNKVFYHNQIFSNFRVDLSIFSNLKKRLLERGISIYTIDDERNLDSDIDIFFDTPYPWKVILWKRIILNKINKNRKNILFCFEPPLIDPFSHMRFLHLFFDLVYVWDDKIKFNEKYRKFFMPNSIYGLKNIHKKFHQKTKLLVLINSNWTPFWPFFMIAGFPKELYSERIKVIDYFDNTSPDTFSFYGKGWNQPQKYNIYQKLFGYKKYKTFKGATNYQEKLEVLSNAKFCLCFENSIEEGYISEKIFDCFKAGCIPIYLGAPNVTDYIPKDCFIDYRRFNDIDELFVFLKSVNEKDYNRYIYNIEKLINSSAFVDNWFEKGFEKKFIESIQ